MINITDVEVGSRVYYWSNDREDSGTIVEITGNSKRPFLVVFDDGESHYVSGGRLALLEETSKMDLYDHNGKPIGYFEETSTAFSSVKNESSYCLKNPQGKCVLCDLTHEQFQAFRSLTSEEVH